ncbi:MAG TPA: hypothetical protein PLA77_02640 [Bacteroidales bacterium]|nr:hypothetical protein [Bacteroidales bacterium]
MLIRCKKIYAVIRLASTSTSTSPRLHLDSISTPLGDPLGDPLDDPLGDPLGDRQLNPNESEPYMLRYNYLQ